MIKHKRMELKVDILSGIKYQLNNKDYAFMKNIFASSNIQESIKISEFEKTIKKCFPITIINTGKTSGDYRSLKYSINEKALKKNFKNDNDMIEKINSYFKNLAENKNLEVTGMYWESNLTQLSHLLKDYVMDFFKKCAISMKNIHKNNS
jgi:hypothetical protein